MSRQAKILSVVALLPIFGSSHAEELRVIDAHGHAYTAGAAFGGPRERDLSRLAGVDIVDAAERILRNHHVDKYLASGAMADVDRWHSAMPDIIVRGVLFPCPLGFVPGTEVRCFADGGEWPDVNWLRHRLTLGTVGFLGEVTTVYAGVPLNDPRLGVYYALAVEFGVPMLVHTGAGPPNKPPACQCPNYDVAMGNPVALRPVLKRHPTLQVLLMHAGGPGFLDETLALMGDYENVSVDLGAVSLAWPHSEIDTWVGAFVDRGFADRLLFGSDAVFSLPATLKVVNQLDALSTEQRRAMLYDNGIRFLKAAIDRDDPRSRMIRLVEVQHAELWSNGNTDLIADLYTVDFVGHFPGTVVRGHDGIRQSVEVHRAAFPDWTEEVDDVISQDDRVVTRFTSRGTNLGEFLGTPPTGRQVEISEVSIFRMVNGKIAEQWVYPDMRSMQEQLDGLE